MKKNILMAICLAVGLSSSSFARVVLSETFDVSKDLLLLQYDSWPDPDDIHSQAAAGCMLKHSDWSDLNYYAVAGAYGIQPILGADNSEYIDSTSTFNLAFGTENVDWTDAHNHRVGSITRIKNKVIPILNAGGRVWVAEAGQSNITADWIAAVLAAGVPASVVKDNVWVIHHSPWNQTLMTDPDDFDYVSANAYMYKRIGDGNADTLDNANRVGTPGFKDYDTSFLTNALVSPNLEARALWADANVVLDVHYAAYPELTNGNIAVRDGGVDFSDTVVMWAILRDDDVETVADFWAKYVVNTNTGPTTGSGTYLESGGLIVMEAENTSSNLDQWLKKTSGLTNQPTGGSYLEFNGNTPISGPAMSPLNYTFKVNEAGTYFFNLYCARETVDGRTDIANDCWIRVEGDYTAGTGSNHALLEDLLVDTKFFGGEDKTLTWAAGARLDLGGEDNKVVAAYQFKAGETYTLVVSGRSQLFKMDRIVFRRNTVALGDSRDLTLPESEFVGQSADYTYVAISDFPNINDGAVPYYIENSNSALAINASLESDRNLFAQANRTFDGTSGVYQVRITTLAEEDGESSYRLLVNGSVVATYTNPYIGPGSPLDREPNLHTWNNVALQNGDTIAIESNAVTNGEIPEGEGTAWARGRWLEIELFRLEDTTTVDSFYLAGSAMDTPVYNGNLVAGSPSGTNNDHRSFVKPDLSDVFAVQGDVESAIFRIYRNDTASGFYQYGDVRLYAMTSAFDPNSATTDYDQLTGTLIGSLPNATDQYLELDVTSFVQGWKTDPSTYHGFAIQGSESFSATGKSFDSPTGANPPQLEVVVNSPTLVGHWPLDDASGTVAADLSGNGYDGTITGGTWISGISGSALDLNGSSAYVTLPPAAFDGVVSTNEITVSLWLDGTAGAALRASDAFGRVINIIFNSNGRLYWDAGNSSTTSYDRISKAVNPSEHSGEWSHWVFTKNAATGVMAIYRNGELWHSGNGNTRTIDSISEVYLGSAGNVSYFDGSLDQVELYNKAFTAEEVAGLYLGTQDPYRAWLSQHSNQLSDTGFDSDPDGDGLANGLEYLFNTDPADGTKKALPSMPSIDENSVVFSFERIVTSSTNTTQFFEYSSDLSNWTQLQMTGVIDPEVSVGSAVNGMELITVTIPTTEMIGNKIFGRIRIIED